MRLSYHVLLFVAFFTHTAIAADFRTTNFVVTADSLEDAKLIAESAERIRADLARYWFDTQLPRWPDPCFVVVSLSDEGNSGHTGYDRHGEYFNWRVELRGTRETILHSVLPHEVLHTVLATHYNRRPIPRWFDEGVATNCEQESEQERLLASCIASAELSSWIKLRALLSMSEYPDNVDQFYDQSGSLVSYLLSIGVLDGKEKGHPDPERYSRQVLLEFERLGLERGWDEALCVYQMTSVETLEQRFRVWLGASNWI